MRNNVAYALSLVGFLFSVYAVGLAYRNQKRVDELNLEVGEILNISLRHSLQLNDLDNAVNKTVILPTDSKGNVKKPVAKKASPVKKALATKATPKKKP